MSGRDGDLDGTVGADWRSSGRLLRQRAAVLAEIGAALEEAGGEGNNLADRLEDAVSRALGERRDVAAGRRTRGSHQGRARGSEAPEAALRAVRERDLSRGLWPVVWFASSGRGADAVTLAVALRAEGGREVIGLWGGQIQPRMVQLVAMELWDRGLNHRGAWLGITGCSRALGAALRERWGQGLCLGHDQRQVRTAVLEHLPVGERAAAEEALRKAWDLPGVAAAREALGKLVEQWSKSYPGAGDRLAQEIEATTMAQALGVCGALALRVATTAPASYLLERALPAGRGQVGPVRLGAITAELLRRQANFRRLGPSERTGLRALLQRLAVMAD